MKTRWRKLFGDLRATWGRFLVMQLVIALALAGVGTVLGARAVLKREIRRSYLATHPADATFVIGEGADETLLEAVRTRPDVVEADERQAIRARVKLRREDPWQMFLLFVARDFDALRLNTIRPEDGLWPPPRGTVLLERTAPAVMGLGDAQPQPTLDHGHGRGHGGRKASRSFAETSLIVQTPHGMPQTVMFAGTVHDAGQAPNWQEHRGCGYVSVETLALLGEEPILHELLVQFRPAPQSMEEAEQRASNLARWLRARGNTVEEVRVPKLRQHPHQALMDASQLVLLAFTLLLLALSAMVVATMLASLLARQTREIGVMKTVGASSAQLAGMYAVLVLGLGAMAVTMAMPLAHVGQRAMIATVALMMNIAIADPTIPSWVPFSVALLGTTVPLAVAAVPIARATRITIAKALAHHGGGSDFVRPAPVRLPLAIRNAVRRPARLVVTLVLLITGGALVMGASNVERGLMRISSKLAAARHYDLDIRLHQPVPAEELGDLALIRGVRTFEAWATSEAAIGHEGQDVDIAHAYPDGGHGSFSLVAVPTGGSALVSYSLLEGRWLYPDDTDAVVLGHNAVRGTHAGERITISVGGRRSTWTVVGIAEEVGGGAAFVNEAAFRRATGVSGVRLLRVATTARTDQERRPVVAELEAALGERGLAVEHVLPSSLMRSIIDDHVLLVARAVILVAAIIALVGLSALGAAMAINVAERTREIGIMKAIGASDFRIFWILIGEALFIGACSSVAAMILAIPVTAAINARIAARGFLATPSFTVSYVALFGWPLIATLGSVVACLPPARRAARLSVRVALGEI